MSDPIKSPTPQDDLKSFESVSGEERPTQSWWTLDEARKTISRLTPALKSWGYNVALYGSVLRNGVGKDLDLILLPWRMFPDPEAAFFDIGRALNARVDGPDYHSVLDATCRCYRDALGRSIDVALYHRQPTPEPADVR